MAGLDLSYHESEMSGGAMKVLVADPIADEGVALLRAQAGLEVAIDLGLAESQLCERVADCEAIIVRSATQITATVLQSAPRLKVVGRAGIGVDNIDVDAATERGVVVLNTPDANATTTAELTVAHILSLSRHLPSADRSMRAGEWKRSKFVGTELAGKTLGIIGYGTIGRIVAARCQGLTMHVMAFDPFVTKEVLEADGIEPRELDQLLSEADYVSLHCPVTEKTRGLINTERIAAMKRGARLINCARGGIVDEAALLAALHRGHLAGAALDVYEREPPTDSPLLEQDNVVLTPHLGASTEEAQVAVGVAIARQVVAFLDHGEAINAVNIPHVPFEELHRIQPYQHLASRLGHLLSALVPGPLEQLEVALYGRAAEVDPHLIAVEALVGLLQERMSTPVNRVNACHLAKRQGISLLESRSAETHDYLSLMMVKGTYGTEVTTLLGTLLGERHPRLVRIDDYEVESVPEGTLLLTRHDDRPGVVGALGNLLGRSNVNISRMQVGVAPDSEKAIAVIGISAPLSAELLRQVEAIPAVETVCQVTF
jgi:D-3-phosphoglycerate dehydrogenase